MFVYLIYFVQADPDWPWQPDIVPVQIFRIGDVAIIGVPSEWT